MKTLIAGNWKMFKTQAEAADTLKQLGQALSSLPKDREVAVFAPFTALSASAKALAPYPFIRLGAQDVYPAAEGAFTGEISPAMIADCGATMVLTGHSERRSMIGESSEFVGQKTAFALANGLDVVLCVGESLQQREDGLLEKILREQLQTGLAGVDDAVLPARLAVAYEPVWAIGTGRVAEKEDVRSAHALIRDFLEQRFPSQGARIRILYGGSVKAENGSGILSVANVNGLLVGGASLKADSFSEIALGAVSK